MNKFYEVTTRNQYSHCQFDKLEEAEAEARRQAWISGKDYHILGIIATAKAPEDINTVNIETV